VSDLKLRIDRADAYYYPDVFVTCDSRDTDPYVKKYPVLVVEVLSPSTEGVDRREKLRNYRFIETLKEYVIVSADERKVEVYRLEPGAEWHAYTFSGSELVELCSVGVTMPMDVAYEDVTT
jgi:Uma2 family endonuclease